MNAYLGWIMIGIFVLFMVEFAMIAQAIHGKLKDIESRLGA